MTEKECPKCTETKDVNEFTRCKKSKDGFYYLCKICKNSQRGKRGPRKDKPNSPEKNRKYYLSMIARNPDYYREKEAEWRKKNPDKVRAKKRRATLTGANKLEVQRRRARILALPHDFTKKDWQSCLEFFGHSCAYCEDSEAKLQMEHYIPLSANGHFTSYNIIPACATCNQSKSNKNGEAWFKEQVFYDQTKLIKILQWLNYHALRNGIKLSETTVYAD